MSRIFSVIWTYPAFQISDGRTGDCANKATQKFLAPYKLDQASLLGGRPNFGVAIDRTDLQVVKQMSKLAIDAENNFNRAMLKACGIKTALGQQLQNEKICNKVLKLAGRLLLQPFLL
ncbi:hypothetical protein PCASD_16858 [Puccinia coronata f. sp. avenae]|uniref:Uncharacterized protein n=1 Tax=Puccinia coronata f. sp. avenae TaxID=200324 RepID=A0A2N5SHA9_9BASI|nr:hypothetical protein PCASD_16858 [Puccinia coronata f. sp. avenae]